MNKFNLKMMGVALLCATGGSLALAETATERQATVPYGDLNLQTSEGRMQFERRVAQAARGVCGPANSLQLQLRVDVRRCVSKAVNQAMQQVHAQQLAGKPAASPERS